MLNSTSNEVLWLISIKALKWSINPALWSIFQFEHTYWLKSRKLCKSKFADWSQSWKQFQLFDWWTAFQPCKSLKLKISYLNFWIDRKIVNNFHMNINYPSQKIDWKKYEYFKKSNFIHVQKLFDIWIILALGYCGIRSTWENWTHIPEIGWDTQKVMLNLQLHILHQTRSSG